MLSQQFDRMPADAFFQRELVAEQILQTRKTLQQNLQYMAKGYGYSLQNNYRLVRHAAALHEVTKGEDDKVKVDLVHEFKDAKSYEEFQALRDESLLQTVAEAKEAPFFFVASGEGGEELFERFLVGCGGVVGVGEEGVGKLGLAGLEGLDALLDGAGTDEFVDEDRVFLADAVGAVGGLCFGGGVPPRVVVDDGVCRSEVESGAAGFEGNEEEGDFSRLEFIDEGTAVFGAAGENEVGDLPLVQLLLDQGEHGSELRKDEDATAFFEEGVDEVGEVFEFCGGDGVVGGDVFLQKSRFAADLAELEEGIEEHHAGLLESSCFDGVAHPGVHGGADGFVEVLLFGGELDGVGEDCFGWKFGGDLVLGAAEDEWRETFLEELLAFFVILFLDRVLKGGAEGLLGAEESGDEEAHQGPEFPEVVFDRGAGETEAGGGL